MDMITLALARAYTKATTEGMGAVKGKNCTIPSKTAIEGGTRIVFAWTKDDGTAKTTQLDVMDGEHGVSVESMTIDDNGHLIVTLSDGNEVDAGAVPVSPGGHVASIPLDDIDALFD